MTDRDTLLTLAETLGTHDRVTHWAVSMRVTGKGDFFSGLLKGRDCRAATFRRTLARFSEIWPHDLAWPSDIPRPARVQSEDAA